MLQWTIREGHTLTTYFMRLSLSLPSVLFSLSLMGQQQSGEGGGGVEAQSPFDVLHSSERRGWKVLAVAANSPASNLGIVPYFSVLTAIDGQRIQSDQEAALVPLIHEGHTQQFTFLQLSTLRTTTVPITPRRGWGGEGLLGLMIRFDHFQNAHLEALHVLDVHHGSPAEKAGLRAHSDWILGTSRLAFKGYAQLDVFLAQHENREGTLLVFNKETFSVREVRMTPSTQWGGAGALGCDVGLGFLHQLPMDGQREVRYEAEEKAAAEEQLTHTMTALSPEQQQQFGSATGFEQQPQQPQPQPQEQQQQPMPFQQQPQQQQQFEQPQHYQQQQFHSQPPVQGQSLGQLAAQQQQQQQPQQQSTQLPYAQHQQQQQQPQQLSPQQSASVQAPQTGSPNRQQQQQQPQQQQTYSPPRAQQLASREQQQQGAPQQSSLQQPLQQAQVQQPPPQGGVAPLPSFPSSVPFQAMQPQHAYAQPHQLQQHFQQPQQHFQQQPPPPVGSYQQQPPHPALQPQFAQPQQFVPQQQQYAQPQHFAQQQYAPAQGQFAQPQYQQQPQQYPAQQQGLP
jgi:hypothetical protein